MSKVKYKDKTYVGTPSLNGVELIGNKNPNEFDLVNLLYPVGTFFESSDENFNPNTYFGGTWTAISGQALVSANDSDSTFKVNNTGGTNNIPVFTHTHSTDSQGAHSHIAVSRRIDTYATSQVNGVALDAAMAWNSTASNVGTQYTAAPVSHSHSTSTSTGQTGTWMNWPPYIIVKCWYRTA